MLAGVPGSELQAVLFTIASKSRFVRFFVVLSMFVCLPLINLIPPKSNLQKRFQHYKMKNLRPELQASKQNTEITN